MGLFGELSVGGEPTREGSMSSSGLLKLPRLPVADWSGASSTSNSSQSSVSEDSAPTLSSPSSL